MVDGCCGVGSVSVVGCEICRGVGDTEASCVVGVVDGVG